MQGIVLSELSHLISIIGLCSKHYSHSTSEETSWRGHMGRIIVQPSLTSNLFPQNNIKVIYQKLKAFNSKMTISKVVISQPNPKRTNTHTYIHT